MLKKILNIILIIMIILSLYSYAVEPSEKNVTQSDNTQNEEQNNIGGLQDEKDTGEGKQNSSENTSSNKNTNSSKNKNNNTTTKSNTDKTTNGVSKTNTSKVQNTTTNQETKSSVADLKSLKVDVEGLTPDFHKNVTEYYLVVDLSIDQIKVTAVPEDDKATVKVTGNTEIEEGENTININVTAEDGTVKKYSIYVTKVDDIEKANADLKLLEVEKYSLYPSFKPDIYNYNLNINEEIDHLEIVAEAEKEKATVEIKGNEGLQEGENLIEINVTAEDGMTVRRYRINTYISSKNVQVMEESKLPAYILLTLLSGCVIGLFIFIVVKNKK